MSLRRTALSVSLPCGCLIAACGGSLPPLRGEIEVGRESYAVFVAGGGAAGGDLYAVRASGGAVFPLTFTNVGEMRPVLSPDGVMVAFLRGQSLRDSTPGSVWILNLLNGADRELPLPKDAGLPVRVGWGSDGRSVVVAATRGRWRMGAPPQPPAPLPIGPTERAAAESSLSVLLGAPVFARVVPCADPDDLCVAADSGSDEPLARRARDPVRWGPDSVAYFVGGVVEIRPLGPGRARRLDWTAVPPRPRQLTMFRGPEGTAE